MTALSVDSTHPYTLPRLQQMLGLTRHAISELIRLGFVQPVRHPGRAYRFSFRDVVLLRAAHDLRCAAIPTRTILRSLRRLRDTLPAEAPLAGLRITAVGDRVTVREQDAQWEPDSGQTLLDFSVTATPQAVSFLAQRERENDLCTSEAGDDPDTLFALAEAMEADEPAAAEAAYRQVIGFAPDYVNAYLNLGFMLCEAGRCAAAASLYDEALRHGIDHSLVHYNRAVTLEKLGRFKESLASYRACLRLAPDLADAHQNAALLYSQTGEPQLAIRHFSAYRRLNAAQR